MTKLRLFDLLEMIGGGTPKRNISEYWDGDIDWLSVKDFNNNGRYVHKAKETITEAGLNKSSTKLLSKGDLIISARGTVGCLAQLTKPMAFNQSCYGIRGKEGINNDYLYYLLITKIAELQQNSHGAVFDTITTETFKILSVNLPPIIEQKIIASVLGALDDKIENNRRMNETLEEMAQAIFKSWFVDFDPVHAKAAGNTPAHMDADTAALFPNSFGDDGLPVGWIIQNYETAMSILDSKRIPLSKIEREKRQGKYPYYGAASLMDCVDDYLFDGTHLLMGEDGSVVHDDGRPFLQYVWGKFWVNNHAHVLQGKNGFSTEFLHCHLNLLDISPYITGAVQLKLNQANMKRIPLIAPSKNILQAFDRMVLPLFSKLQKNFDENQTLAELRDTLLPKLMSGEIRVANAEREVEGLR